MTLTSVLRIQSTSLSFQNITFDGNEVDAGTAFVLCMGGITFSDCVFQDCMTTTANGGAVYVISQNPTFENCTFDNNTGVQGGHMYVASGTVTIQGCTFTNGHAMSDGGAIKNNTSPPGACTITACTITGNSAALYGGGISNTGYLSLSTTKLYDNTAPGGGADLAQLSNSSYINDSIESLVDLFAADGILPTAWVNDYNTELAVEIPGGRDPLLPSTLKKLNYIIPPTEVVLDAASLGTADDGKVTGLESGKYYKVTSGEVVSYSKADGTLTAIESEASPLDGNEITGLINGETYLVEEYTPPTPEPDPSEEPDPTPEPTPTPSPSNSSGSGGSSYSSKPAVTAPKAVVLSYGKAVLDTTKTRIPAWLH